MTFDDMTTTDVMHGCLVFDHVIDTFKGNKSLTEEDEKEWCVPRNTVEFFTLPVRTSQMAISKKKNRKFHLVQKTSLTVLGKVLMILQQVVLLQVRCQHLYVYFNIAVV